MSTENDKANIFFLECKRIFCFLTEKYGFSSPNIEMDTQIQFDYVTFYNKNLAVECVYDEREEDIGVYVLRLLDGMKREDCFRRDSNGIICRVRLTQILMSNGVCDLRFKNGRGSLAVHSQEIYINRVLLENVRLLKEYGQKILSDDISVFDNVR